MVRIRVAAVALAAIVLTCAVVRAQDTAVVDDERARAHYVAGESHFAAERWADAAREFQQAYALSQRPEMLINLSRAHERAGELAAAVADLELLLERYPETSYRLEAEQRIEVMRTKLQAEPPAQPLPPVTLEQEPTVASTPEPVRPWPPRWPTLIAGSLAIVTGVVALGTGLRAHALHGDLEDRCPNGRCVGSFESDRDKGRALSRASTGLMFTSIALAGATAALWVTDYRRDKRLQLGIQGSGAQLRMQF